MVVRLVIDYLKLGYICYSSFSCNVTGVVGELTGRCCALPACTLSGVCSAKV